MRSLIAHLCLLIMVVPPTAFAGILDELNKTIHPGTAMKHAANCELETGLPGDLCMVDGGDGIWLCPPDGAKCEGSGWEREDTQGGSSTTSVDGGAGVSLPNFVSNGSGTWSLATNDITFDLAQCDLNVNLDGNADPQQAVQTALNNWNEFSATQHVENDNDFLAVCVSGYFEFDGSDMVELMYDDGVGDPSGTGQYIYWTILPTDYDDGCGMWDGATRSATPSHGMPIACDEDRSPGNTQPLMLHFNNVVGIYDRDIQQSGPSTFLHAGGRHFNGGAAFWDVLAISGNLSITMQGADTTTTDITLFDVDNTGPVGTDTFIGFWADGIARSDLSRFNFWSINNGVSTDYTTVGMYSQLSFGMLPPALNFTGLGIGHVVTGPNRMSEPWRGQIRANKISVQVGAASHGCSYVYHADNPGGEAEVTAGTGCAGHRYNITYEGNDVGVAFAGSTLGGGGVRFENSHHENGAATLGYHQVVLGAGSNSVTGEICIHDDEADLQDDATDNASATCDVGSNWGAGKVAFIGGAQGGNTSQSTLTYSGLVYGEDAEYFLYLDGAIEMARNDSDANSMRGTAEAGIVFDTYTTSNANPDAEVFINDVFWDYEMTKIPASFGGKVTFQKHHWLSDSCEDEGFNGQTRQGDTCTDNSGADIGKTYVCANVDQPLMIGCNESDDWVEAGLTQVTHLETVWARDFEVDGTWCTVPESQTIGTHPTNVINCADNGASVFYFQAAPPTGWDYNDSFTVNLLATNTAADTDVLDVDFQMACIQDGVNMASFYGAKTSVPITFTTALDFEESGPTAIVGNGTCTVDDTFLFFKVSVDATATTTAMATTWIYGVQVEFTLLQNLQ